MVRSVKNAAVFVLTTGVATAGLYGVLDYASTHLGMEPSPLPVAYSVPVKKAPKPVSHEACWVETHEGGPEVVCNTSDKWASWVARCIEDALADKVSGDHNEIAQGCMVEADKHANDKA